MPRYIDADALMARFQREQNTMYEHGREYSFSFLNSGQEISTEWYAVEQFLEEAPTIDAEPVVRCRDCKWYGTYQLTKYGEYDKRYKPTVCVKGEYSIMRNEDWYCADGERKDDE